MTSGLRPLPSALPFAITRMLLAVCVLLVQTSAYAHGASAGMAGFGGGLIHPLITPAHLLLLLA
ncbi:MAG: HupE/UreJ family protein, partial [Rhodoferax sp.]|nr:HupE/UreJ family protein [Rhodoferax sp.]